MLLELTKRVQDHGTGGLQRRSSFASDEPNLDRKESQSKYLSVKDISEVGSLHLTLNLLFLNRHDFKGIPLKIVSWH